MCFIPSKVVLISGGKTYAPIYGGDRTKNNVAIMINVYENSEIVEKMLDVFQEKGAKATFFIGGCWADDNQETLKRMAFEGHEIANHGYFHKDHKKLNYEGNYHNPK